MVLSRSTKLCVVIPNIPILDITCIWDSMCKKYDMYYIGVYEYDCGIRVHLQSSCKRKMTMCYVSELFDSYLPSMDSVRIEYYSSIVGICLHSVGNYRGRVPKKIDVKPVLPFGEESTSHITSRHLDALSSKYFTDGIFDCDTDPMEVVFNFATEILTLDNRNVNVYGSVRSIRVNLFRVSRRFPLGVWWVTSKKYDVVVEIFKVWFCRLEDSMNRNRSNLSESSVLFLDDIVRIFTDGEYCDTYEFKKTVCNKTLISLENYKMMFNDFNNK